MRLVPLEKEEMGALSACWGKCHPQDRKRANTRIWSSWHIWSSWASHIGLPAARTAGNTCLLFKPPHLWYFVITAWDDWGRLCQHNLGLILSGLWLSCLCPLDSMPCLLCCSSSEGSFLWQGHLHHHIILKPNEIMPIRQAMTKHKESGILNGRMVWVKLQPQMTLKSQWLKARSQTFSVRVRGN